MYAVMGITGNVGGAVARALLARGEKVRGIVRNPEKAAEWQKQGVELFKADYDDAEALTAAFSGVDGVFVMVPPNFAPAPGYVETKATLEILHRLFRRPVRRRRFISRRSELNRRADWVSSPAHIFSNRRWVICRSRKPFFAQAGS
jgi:nucleoside-diphosphate-sugar epimerase